MARVPGRPRRGERPQADSAHLLAIDIGNTHTVLGVFVGERLERFWRVTSGV
jgi:hypothetical protein